MGGRPSPPVEAGVLLGKPSSQSIFQEDFIA